MFKMAETNNVYPNLRNEQEQQFRLNKINKIRDYFVTEIKERELMSKRLSKYVAFFDYLDKSLIILSITTGSVSLASFATVIGVPVEIISARFSLAFFNICKKNISIYLIKKTIKNNKK